MSQLSSAIRLASMLVLLLLAADAEGWGLLPSGSSPLAAAVSIPPCQKDVNALQTACLKFVQKNGPKVPPSPECCAAVKAISGAKVPCVCHYLGSSAARDNISMDKIFFVTKQCGVAIPGTCGGGSKTKVV